MLQLMILRGCRPSPHHATFVCIVPSLLSISLTNPVAAFSHTALTCIGAGLVVCNNQQDMCPYTLTC
jgi:hypothetical protein